MLESSIKNVIGGLIIGISRTLIVSVITLYRYIFVAVDYDSRPFSFSGPSSSAESTVRLVLHLINVCCFKDEALDKLVLILITSTPSYCIGIQMFHFSARLLTPIFSYFTRVPVRKMTASFPTGVTSMWSKTFKIRP